MGRAVLTQFVVLGGERECVPLCRCAFCCSTCCGIQIVLLVLVSNTCATREATRRWNQQWCWGWGDGCDLSALVLSVAYTLQNKGQLCCCSHSCPLTSSQSQTQLSCQQQNSVLSLCSQKLETWENAGDQKFPADESVPVHVTTCCSGRIIKCIWHVVNASL